MMVPTDRVTFERFFELKQQIADQLKKRESQQEKKKISKSLPKHLEQLRPPAEKDRMYFNMQNVDMEGPMSALLLFGGENGKLVQTGFGDIAYVGGYMGNKFN